MSKLDKVLVWVIVMVAGVLVSSLTLTVLWGWFIASTFKLPRLSPAEAFGIMLVVRFVIPLPEYPADKNKSFAAMTGKFLMGSAVVLVIGFLVHLFV